MHNMEIICAYTTCTIWKLYVIMWLKTRILAILVHRLPFDSEKIFSLHKNTSFPILRIYKLCIILYKLLSFLTIYGQCFYGNLLRAVLPPELLHNLLVSDLLQAALLPDDDGCVLQLANSLHTSVR